MFGLTFEQLLLCLAYALLVFTGLRLLHLVLYYRYPLYQRIGRLLFLLCATLFWYTAERIVRLGLKFAIWRHNRQLRKFLRKMKELEKEEMK